MSTPSLERDATTIRQAAREISSARNTYDALVDLAGDADLVLIGEATHGTQEFYAIRAELTRRLIAEKGFRAVSIEGDWPDTFRVHRYVTGRGDDTSAAEALGGFQRFPSWMWRNTVVVEFVEWLRHWNERASDGHGLTGFYGMDLYSMHTSIESVLRYLEKVDPQAAQRARCRYACFEHFSTEPQEYGRATVRQGREPCEDEVVSQLVELRQKQAMLIHCNGRLAREDFFSAEQNARLVMNAERYYRSMFYGRDESWNLRDTHMFETLEELRMHLGNGRGRIVVWAHNSHLGDARATEMGKRGELNVGQLVRSRSGDRSFSIGFSTYSGSVTAANDWGGPAQRKDVRPGMPGSYEELFHATGLPRFWLNLQESNEATRLLEEPRLQRAIGVIYRPQTERWSHYFHASMPRQFSAVIHLDETHALTPLERDSRWDVGEYPETYPSAL
ncbi:MAG: erythromycin esterase [Chthoniobacter sp. 12-60-6]|nr:MAG: erythromycin esterase [Chthoniobacter sp. 12-60-6]